MAAGGEKGMGIFEWGQNDGYQIGSKNRDALPAHRSTWMRPPCVSWGLIPAADRGLQPG
jgi:hypothetical protein